MGMIGREQIIECLKEFSFGKSYVYAMWLEGADGIGQVDAYSDIDFWFDVEQSRQETFLHECIAELEKLAGIDSRVDNIRREIAQSNIHLEDTSEYLTLDICVQSHEIRGIDVTCYVENDIAEQPLILFDKKNIISFCRGAINEEEIRRVFGDSKNRILQMSRVRKYIQRNQYLEAYGKYLENVAEPLVSMARLLYTPRHYEYALCHISRHLPEEAVSELTRFYQVTSLKEIEENLQKAEQLFRKYEGALKGKYPFLEHI